MIYANVDQIGSWGRGEMSPGMAVHGAGTVCLFGGLYGICTVPQVQKRNKRGKKENE
ncbi:MAG: hypothetical protein HFH85_16535 [Lachnospiraceae bacterium]|nr:hypothetical protein [Lachnospiraceae bacterium]